MDQLIERLKVEMKLRGLSERSCFVYEELVQIFKEFCGKPLAEASEDDVKTFLHYLITEKNLAASSVNVYNAALKFFYQKNT